MQAIRAGSGCVSHIGSCPFSEAPAPGGAKEAIGPDGTRRSMPCPPMQPQCDLVLGQIAIQLRPTRGASALGDEPQLHARQLAVLPHPPPSERAHAELG